MNDSSPADSTDKPGIGEGAWPYRLAHRGHAEWVVGQCLTEAIGTLRMIAAEPGQGFAQVRASEALQAIRDACERKLTEEGIPL